ncbi:MAG: hypothetical protein AMJ94_08505 [Deltaproteobacteria bacterium SM23_61]|nr:MAG: hypothetical protein AMJ94_08505 [Deltaproteobacteria bacterium SM23_61]
MGGKRFSEIQQIFSREGRAAEVLRGRGSRQGGKGRLAQPKGRAAFNPSVKDPISLPGSSLRAAAGRGPPE